MASCGKSLGICETKTAGMEMGFMALKAEERFILFEHVIGHRPMGVVTDHTVLSDRSMFENKRSLLVRMTIEAKIIDPFNSFQVFNQRTVMLVTARACHLSLSNRVTGGEIDLCGDVPVTIQAELRIFFNESFFIVNGVAA